MKTNVLPLADAPDGSEEVIVNQGVGANQHTKRMPAAALASAANRPTPAELQAAILAALVEGSGIDFVVDEANAKITISVDASIATTAALNTGLGTKQDKSALLTAIAGLSIGGQAGKVIKVNANGDGFVLAVDDAGTAGGALVDGTYGDVIVSNGGTKMTVSIAVDEAYGAGWNADMTPPTKNATFAKIEAIMTALSGKVSTASVGAANGVASLDAGGKVPAAQLPSYVDDVLEYSSAANFPGVGETGKVYVALDTNKQSRWSGTAYVELTASPGTTDNVPEGPTNKYYTDIRVRAAPMTGLIDTVGAPAATDSLLTVLGKLKRQAFTLLGDVLAGTFTVNTIWVNTNKALFQHDGTNGYIRSQVGALFIGSAGQNWLTLDAGGTLSTNGGAVIGPITLNDYTTYGCGVKQSRTGQVGYHMYNGGATAEWIMYQPAHASGDDFRIATQVAATVTDRFKIGADGTCWAMSNLYAGGEIWVNSKIVRFGGAGSSQYIYYDGAKFQINGVVNTMGFDFGCGNAFVTGLVTVQGTSAGVVHNDRTGNAWSYTGYAHSNLYRLYSSTAGGDRLTLDSNGSLWVAGNFSAASDARLKSNVRPIEGALGLALRLRGVRYEKDDVEQIGVIAQEVEEVVPELVTTNEDGFKAVDYDRFTAILIEAVKELSAKVESLEARLAA
jgi:hypothetical protein